jgi:hypothetical protein
VVRPGVTARSDLARRLDAVALSPGRRVMTQPALSCLEAGCVIPTIPLLERISAALDADLIVAISRMPPEIRKLCGAGDAVVPK